MHASHSRPWSRSLLITGLALPLLVACGPVDHKALHRIACQQASGSLDMASVSQLDVLRKALGIAPGVDPIRYCRSLGVTLEPLPSTQAEPAPDGGS